MKRDPSLEKPRRGLGLLARRLHPAAFAMVMSTGIISIASARLGMTSLAWGLFAFNIAAYGVLLLLLISRLVLDTAGVKADTAHPGRSWGFLTFVVGTNTLSSQCALFGFPAPASILFWIGLILYVLVLYAVYRNLTVGAETRLENGVSGATLLTVVATQSVAVAAVASGPVQGLSNEVTILLALLFWAAGFMLYVILASLLVHRMLFSSFSPGDWNGTYWICMGAVAITTLAGSGVSTGLAALESYSPLAPAVLVSTLLAWAIGTWWIPLLVVLDVWSLRRTGIDGTPPAWISVFPWLRLTFGSRETQRVAATEWGRVFPLGMYTAATAALASASGIAGLSTIAAVGIWVALAAWVLTLTGSARKELRSGG